MKLNIRKAMTLVRKELERDWNKLTFTYKAERDEATAQATGVTLNNHDDDISVLITVYSGGGSVFRAVFDKIEKTNEVLALLQQFNYDDPFFKAFVRDDGYLELRHYFVCYEVNMFKNYAGEFMSRLAGLADDKNLQNLTRYTH